MPSRSATAMLALLPEAHLHSTRWNPRSWKTQSTITRTARVTSPLPVAAGSSQQPASATPCPASMVRNSTPPTSAPRSRMP